MQLNQEKQLQYDVTVVGGGPAGMAAAIAASDEGARVCLLEREEKIGGILKQCIHDGFGVLRFSEQLTGPEYAWRYAQELGRRPVDVLTRTFLTSIEKNGSSRDGYLLKIVNSQGLSRLETRTLVMAMGCRERTDRQVFIHGERPAGIFTAGQAQDLINLKGYLPGKRCVILGSGDIGLIMAQRLTLEGASVEGLYEIGSEPSGLNRNVSQCLEDYGIPLHLNSTVLEVQGRKRVEAVTVARMERGIPVQDTVRTVPCDSLILSVGLIPENEMLQSLAPQMDERTRGPRVNQYMETSCPGVFSCGNALHVNDLVDYVSQSGETAGRAAALYASNRSGGDRGGEAELTAAGNLSYVLPQKLRLPAEGAVPLFFRVNKSAPRGKLTVTHEGTVILEKTFRWLKAAEMERLDLDLSVFSGSNGGSVAVRMSEEGS
ncbi:MAG: FAD-dependent oxidoreductase [Spirochaetales bacterium]|nr:FAD-dependent oxidoreductase [Spirochaetales bacterium]